MKKFCKWENEEYEKKTPIIQIGNGLILMNLKTKPTIIDSLKNSLVKYARQSMFDLPSSLMYVHLTQTIMYQTIRSRVAYVLYNKTFLIYNNCYYQYSFPLLHNISKSHLEYFFNQQEIMYFCTNIST